MHVSPGRHDNMTTLRRAGTAAAIVLSLGGCGDLLKVSNPGSLQEGQLADPALEQFLINGAIGEFQAAFGNYALWSGVLADEAFTQIGLHLDGHLHFFGHGGLACLRPQRRHRKGIC